MLGYFGKNGIVPPPAGVPAAQVQAELISKPAASTAVEAEDELEPQAIPVAAAPMDPVAAKLAQLRAAVDAKRAQKEAEVRSIQEMQRRQAEYGRDTQQYRPPQAGYATEAEKLMGGQTGYARPQPAPAAPVAPGTIQGLAGLGALTNQVSAVTDDLTRLTAIVKQLTKDVKAGVVPRSELEKAVKELQQKSAEAKLVSKQLSGWVDTSGTTKVVIGLAALLGGYLVLKRWL